jgi:dolichyl-phosphate-mannose-protein mannosyltransferase
MMRAPLAAAKLCLLLIAIEAAVPVAYADPAATAGVNLLHNPGLEFTVPGSLGENLPRDWEIYKSGQGQGAVFSFTGDAVYEGRRALLIDIENPQAVGIFQTVRVRPDSFYRFSVRVKTESLVSQGPGVHLLVFGVNAVSNDITGTTNGWSELQFFFKTATDQTEAIVAIRVGTIDRPAQGRVWLDDVSLRKTDGPPTALAQSASAETALESAYPWPGPGFVVFIVLACLLFALFVFLSIKKKPVMSTRIQDLILAGGLTLICAFISFYHLGSFDTPQTYYHAQKQGESFTLDLGAPLPVSRIMYFMALGIGSYRLDFSDDSSNWRDPKTLEQESAISQILWRTENVGFVTRYLRVTAVAPGAMLGEIAVFSDEDGSLLPVKAVLPGTAGKAEGMERVCDEPGRVPPIPSYLNGMYFDECYHARSAYEYTLGMDATEFSHPPLGKLLMSLGIELFGFTPFGWRFMGTILGILMVPLIYAFGLALFKKREWAFIAAFLLAFDFMHFTQTRIATIDVFAVFWIMLMYWFMYRALQEDPFSRRPGKLLGNLFISGLCFGLGAASKWIALYGAIGMALSLIAWYASESVRYFKGFSRSQKEDPRVSEKKTLGEIITPHPSPTRSLWNHTRPFLLRTGLVFAFSVLVFIALPAGIYIASYVPFMAAHANQNTSPFQLVLNEQRVMYDYHVGQNEAHDSASPWYEWPIDYKPTWFSTGNRYLSHDTVSDIFSFGNPAIWWAGILAAGALLFLLLAPCAILLYYRARYFVKRKYGITANAIDAVSPAGARLDSSRCMPAGLFILIALASQYLPWIIVPRKTTFIYHFFASVPFLILAIVSVTKTLVEKKPGLRWTAFLYLGIVMLLFFLFYPLLGGARAYASFVKGVLAWFPTWFPYL